MIGAIAGDVIGSVFEGSNLKSKDFPLFSKDSRFTDDSVLTAAVADCILHDRDYAAGYRAFYHRYPWAGYGFLFSNWAKNPFLEGYGSYGNGSAMRVSPVAWAFDTLEEVLSEAAKSATATHNSVEGIKGAQAIATATYLARTGKTKSAIVSAIVDRFAYDLDFTIDGIREDYAFDVTCQGTVPQALVAFRDSEDFEDAIRSAISIGGDSDTIACMAGSIAAAFHGGVPARIDGAVRARLDERLSGILDPFERRYL
jgi:ADP-ribosylglycohydrolase